MAPLGRLAVAGLLSSVLLAPAARAADCTVPMELPDKPQIQDFADYKDFVADIMEYKKKKRRQIQHKKKCPQAYVPQKQPNPDPTVIEGPETLSEALARKKHLPEVDYTRHQKWHDRSTSRSFALPDLDAGEMSERSIDARLRNLFTPEPPARKAPNKYAAQGDERGTGGFDSRRGGAGTDDRSRARYDDRSRSGYSDARGADDTSGSRTSGPGAPSSKGDDGATGSRYGANRAGESGYGGRYGSGYGDRDIEAARARQREALKRRLAGRDFNLSGPVEGAELLPYLYSEELTGDEVAANGYLSDESEEHLFFRLLSVEQIVRGLAGSQNPFANLQGAAVRSSGVRDNRLVLLFGPGGEAIRWTGTINVEDCLSSCMPHPHPHP